MSGPAAHSLATGDARAYTLCKAWEHNGDGALEEARTFSFRISSPGGEATLNVQRTVAEGQAVCGAGFTSNEPLTVEELPFAAIDDATSPPAWSVEGGASGTGWTAALPVGSGTLTFTSRSAPRDDRGVLTRSQDQSGSGEALATPIAPSTGTGPAAGGPDLATASTLFGLAALCAAAGLANATRKAEVRR